MRAQHLGALDDGSKDGASDGTLEDGSVDGVLEDGASDGALVVGADDGAAEGVLEDGASDGGADAVGSAVGAWVGLQLRSTPDGRSLGYSSGNSVQQVRAHESR